MLFEVWRDPESRYRIHKSVLCTLLFHINEIEGLVDKFGVNFTLGLTRPR